MYDEIKRLGGNPVMWKTGHSLIKSRMKELKAAMAGEMSGHIFFADRYFGFDDAVCSPSCRLAEILVEKRKKDRTSPSQGFFQACRKPLVTPEIGVEALSGRRKVRGRGTAQAGGKKAKDVGSYAAWWT